MNFENMNKLNTGLDNDKSPRKKLFIEIRAILDQARGLLIVPRKDGSIMTQVDIDRLNGYFKEIEFSYQEGTSGTTFYRELKDEIFTPILEKLQAEKDKKAKENLEKVWFEISMKVFGHDPREFYIRDREEVI